MAGLPCISNPRQIPGATNSHFMWRVVFPLNQRFVASFLPYYYLSKGIVSVTRQTELSFSRNFETKTMGNLENTVPHCILQHQIFGCTSKSPHANHANPALALCRTALANGTPHPVVYKVQTSRSYNPPFSQAVTLFSKPNAICGADLFFSPVVLSATRVLALLLFPPSDAPVCVRLGVALAGVGVGVNATCPNRNRVFCISFLSGEAPRHDHSESPIMRSRSGFLVVARKVLKLVSATYPLVLMAWRPIPMAHQVSPTATAYGTISHHVLTCSPSPRSP